LAAKGTHRISIQAVEFLTALLGAVVDRDNHFPEGGIVSVINSGHSDRVLNIFLKLKVKHWSLNLLIISELCNKVLEFLGKSKDRGVLAEI
jgi:hypothetical protein